jgi:hypothetical protein
MEEEILQEMIRDRENQIKLVQTKVGLTAVKVDRLRDSLNAVKKEYSKEHVERTLTLENYFTQYRRAVDDLHEGLARLDMKKQHTAAQLHLYNDIMKAVAATPMEGDSSYVLRMQAQLCKAMHGMGMMEVQLVMLQNAAAERHKFLKDVVTQTMEEKSQVELQIMNDLIAVGGDLKEVEEKHRGMIQLFSEQKDKLLEKIEKQQEKEDEDDAEAEEEVDEDEKEELKEILTQGREEMERMEAENKEEFKRLQALKAKVAAIRGEPFVNELVASIAEEFKRDEEDEEE